MSKQLLAFLFFIVISLVVSGQEKVSRRLQQLEVSGSGYKAGLKHGIQYKEQISELITRWKENIRQTLKGDPDSILQDFLQQTDFIPAIRRYAPELLEEVKGIAKGSGQPFNDIYAFQLPDEFWVYVDGRGKDSTLHHCSGIALPGKNGKPGIISQNLDIDQWMDGFQLLLHIQKGKQRPEQYILTCPGMIGFNGMNEKGIGVCVNTLMSLRAGKTGLPVSFMVRSLLNFRDGQQAIKFVTETPHASGQNYLLGIRDSVYDFEASSKSVSRVFPSDSSGVLIHTNHALVNRDIKPWYEKYYKAFLDGRTRHYNSETRFSSIQKRVTGQKRMDHYFISSILRSKDDARNPVCNSAIAGKGFFTFGSVIMTLSGTPCLQVTAGPPDESEYRSFYFSRPSRSVVSPE